VCPSDAAAAEETAGEDERADRVESDADRVDGNVVDEAGVVERLGRDHHSKRDQRQTGKLHDTMHIRSDTNCLNLFPPIRILASTAASASASTCLHDA